MNFDPPVMDEWVNEQGQKRYTVSGLTYSSRKKALEALERYTENVKTQEIIARMARQVGQNRRS